MPRRPAADISIKQFRDALVDQGFAHITPIGRYIDVRARVPGQYLEPIKDARGRVQRRETLEAFLGRRKAAEAARAAIRAENDRRLKIAGQIAPTVFSPCRADLNDARAIAQLADDYLTRLASAGSVGFGDLLQMGWSKEQLRRHGDAARTVADRRRVACRGEALGRSRVPA